MSTIKIKLKLYKPKATVPVAIFLRVTLPAGRMKINTGFKVHPRAWDSVKQRVVSEVPNAEEVNAQLLKGVTEIVTVIEVLKKTLSRYPSPEEVILELGRTIGTYVT
jgi:hypothetical protein